MSLPSKISTVVLEVRNGMSVVSTHTITVKDLLHPWTLVFREGRKGVSITGKKRKKGIVRGFDSKLSFTWEDVSNQESAIIALLDDMKVVSDNNYDLRFNVSGGTDYLFLVPEEGEYNQNYINQIKRTPTSISFELAEIQDDISYV